MGYSLKKALQELDDLTNLITQIDDKIKNKKIKNMMPDFFLDEKNHLEKNKDISEENKSLRDTIIQLEKNLKMEQENYVMVLKENENLKNKNQELIEILTKVSEYMGIVIEGIEEKI